VTVDHAATPEQFATFFAVVARYLGVPVRVVTGFRAPSAANTSGPLPAGQYELTNRDAWTWDEVPVVGYGWVVVDATPVLTTADPSAPSEPVKATPRVQAKQATALPGKGAAHAIAKPVKVKLTLPLHVDWALVFGAGLPAAIVLTLLSGGLGVPALRRRLRRLARHRLDDPVLLATGAWLELLDGLSRLSVEVPSSATSTDVAAQVADRFGADLAPAVELVGTLADQALYSTELPVDAESARLAWESQRRIYRSMRHSVPGRDRARALLLVGTAPGRPVDEGPR
ncbi:MAG TPA: transglutaminase-like domain-containing protein, partial [Acidimicrobiales bacterium]|nr:transglutaminase-like domain-containing protein [Acidimicrobiales bacterium]